MLTITAEDLKTYNVCYVGQASCDLFQFAQTRDRWSALDIADQSQYSPSDRLWLVLRESLIPKDVLQSLACDFAERMLNACDFTKLPGDQVWHAQVKALREAINVRRLWIEGSATDDELALARADVLKLYKRYVYPGNLTAMFAKVWRATRHNSHELLYGLCVRMADIEQSITYGGGDRTEQDAPKEEWIAGEQLAHVVEVLKSVQWG